MQCTLEEYEKHIDSLVKRAQANAPRKGMPVVTMSTVHKFKGAEAERVRVDQRICNPRAFNNSRSVQLVATSRARRFMYLDAPLSVADPPSNTVTTGHVNAVEALRSMKLAFTEHFSRFCARVHGPAPWLLYLLPAHMTTVPQEVQMHAQSLGMRLHALSVKASSTPDAAAGSIQQFLTAPAPGKAA